VSPAIDNMILFVLFSGTTILLIIFYFLSKKVSSIEGAKELSNSWLIRIPFSILTAIWIGFICILIWLEFQTTEFSGETRGSFTTIIKRL